MIWTLKFHMIFFLLPALIEEECLRKHQGCHLFGVQKAWKYGKLQLKWQVTSISEFHLHLKCCCHHCRPASQNCWNLSVSWARVTSIESVVNKFFATYLWSLTSCQVFGKFIWKAWWVRRRLVSTTLQGTWGRNGDMTITLDCKTKRSKGQRDCRKYHSQLSNIHGCKQLGPLCCIIWSPLCLHIKLTLLPVVQKFRNVILNGGYFLGLKLKGRLWK